LTRFSVVVVAFAAAAAASAAVNDLFSREHCRLGWVLWRFPNEEPLGTEVF